MIINLSASALANNQDIALSGSELVQNGTEFAFPHIPPGANYPGYWVGGLWIFSINAVGSIASNSNPSPAAIAVRVNGVQRGVAFAQRFSSNAAHTVGISAPLLVSIPREAIVTFRNVSGAALTLEPGSVCGIVRVR